ncbi:GNAT family protein [Pseudophaeobacter sp.]|uniref:GNAT family N-acetyltransferase n=1 Tax=Pseudophaeobacter sp. TaxID=1971739 RepID=UPI00262A327F|nr:GNAT family protein [Pseudophaeobacter sp.]
MDQRYCIPEMFETARYRLRRANPSDALAIFESYATDPTVTRYIGWRPHSEPCDTEDFLEEASAEWETGKGFPSVVFPQSEPDHLIGMFHPHVFGHKVTYGYVLAKKAWGNGCATEVMTWLVDHALEHPAIYRAEAFCDIENRGSARVMEKAGMIREGLLRRFFIHPNISEAPRDCLMYAKVK